MRLALIHFSPSLEGRRACRTTLQPPRGYQIQPFSAGDPATLVVGHAAPCYAPAQHEEHGSGPALVRATPPRIGSCIQQWFIWCREGMASQDSLRQRPRPTARCGSHLGTQAVHWVRMPWPDLLLYAFSLTPLLPPTLHRIAESDLSGRVWFSLLHRLLNGVPWALPRKRDHLSQLQGSIWHLDQGPSSCMSGP